MAIVGFLEILTAVLCFLFFWHWRRNLNSASTKYRSLVGMMPSLFRNRHRIHDHVVCVLKKRNYTFKFKGPLFSHLDFWVTSDPKNMHYILSKNFHNYPKGPEFREIFDVLGDGIFNSDSDSWKKQRKILHSLLKDRKFEEFAEKTIRQKVVQGLIPVLEDASKKGIELDMQDVFQRFGFDTVCLWVLGFDPNCLSVGAPKALYEKAFSDMEEAVLHRHIVPPSLWKLQRWLDIGEEKKFRKAREIFDSFLYQHISLKQEKLQKLGQEEASLDLLTGFMEQREHAGAFGKSEKFLKDVAINLMVAGRDAITVVLTWFFWLIEMHPSVENKILEEIKATLLPPTKQDGDEWMVWTAMEVNKLVYLHAALCETLRLYPPVPFNHKVSIKSDILPSGHRIKANTRIVLSLYTMGKMEGIWGEDCLEFKPERWITRQGGIMHVPSYKFAAFNAGPRTCLGKELSFMQMKLVAATILWNYKVQMVEGHHVYPCNSASLQMEHGLKVRVAKRSAQW